MFFLKMFDCRAYSHYADQSSLQYNNYSNYGNYSNFPTYHTDYNNVNNINNINNVNNVSYGYGTSDPAGYNNGRFNAVAQKLSVISNLSEDLNESSIGTHV